MTMIIDKTDNLSAFLHWEYLFLTTGYSLGCDNGWVESPLDICYKFVIDQKTSWSQAQGLCLDMGGHLATLESEAEIIWIKGYHSHKSILRKEKFWVGGYEKSGVWYWKGDLADSPILATDWANGQPDDFNGPQDCLVLYGDGERNPADWFKFDDGHCSFQTGFICEKPE